MTAHRDASFDLARALFTPRSVALVGASSDPAKNAARPLRYLRRHGFQGRILPVNPGAAEIDGVPCYKSIADLPEQVDHAFVMVGADRVAQAVRDCARAGIACATILSDGFAEAGPEGRARERDLRAAAGRVRLLGPNSIGVIDTGGFACSANATLEMEHLPQGGYGVISQSGSMIGALLSQGAARGIGFSSLVSVGNETDLTVGEVGELMLGDPRCTAILLFLEAIRDRESLARLARKAHAAGKPVLAYKLGRSKAGQALAATHTGALAGDDATAEALLASLGIARVKILETLYEAPPLFIGTAPSSGRRVAVVTTTGGGGAMVVDALAINGLELAPALPEVRAILAAHGVKGGEHGLIDLTLAGTRADLVRAVVEALMQSDMVDAVAMVIGSSSQFHPELAVAPLRGFAGSGKPMGVYLVPAADKSRRMLTDEGLAVFRTAESCAEGLRACLTRRLPSGVPAPEPELADRVAALVAKGRVLDEVASRAGFDVLGIAGPEGGLAANPEEARAIHASLARPVALKIVSGDIAHKSDSGGLILGLDDGDSVAKGFERLMREQARAHPGARLRGVLVQAMETGIAEALIGYRDDPQAGPMVMLGAGGVMAEILEDTTLRAAPVDLSTAREMLDEVGFLRAARGFRGKPKGDLEALARAIVALSRLALCNSVAEAEINPVLIREDGVLALDALVVGRATAEMAPEREDAGVLAK
ncbi:MAG: acetate--CoA ligase family protein [Pseudooceanicola nanhaiensis]